MKASGGWYTQVCQHGVVYASNFLFFAESVRDVIDVHKSTKCNPPVTVLDTPCTAAAHMILRDMADVKNGKLANKEDGQAWKWFGGNPSLRGCFETPQLGKDPSKISIENLELETQRMIKKTLPHSSELQSEEHPKTRDTKRYFLGDQFHNTNFPHKSELCRYHDINLCPQLKTVKTSNQENIQNIRNQLRLRTACTQIPATHMFYNAVVMDRAHNRKIVKQQSMDLRKDWSNRHPDYKFIV